MARPQQPSSTRLLDERPMTAMQFVIFIVCCLTNIADGIDLASMSFAAPVLVRDWGIKQSSLGIVFGAAGAGLLIGALGVSNLVDRFGRRRVMLTMLATLSVVLFLSASAKSIAVLAALRFITGLALGTMVVCLNVTVAEFSNLKWRNLAVSMFHTGFSLGTMLGGTLAALTLESVGWPALFYAAALLNAVTFALTFFLVPESPTYLIQCRPEGALAKLNRVLAKLGQPGIDTLPDPEPKPARSSLAALLAPGFRQGTLLIWFAQFAFAIVGYLLLSWKPTVMVNAGLTPTQAGYSAIIIGLFGIAGHAVMGWFARVLGPMMLTAIFLALLSASLVVFGLQPPSVPGLIFTSGLTGFFNVGAYSGLFLVTLAFYPAALRTAGVGALVAWARLGGIVGPILGGVMLGLGMGRELMFPVLAVIALLPMVAMFAARKQVAEEPARA